MKWFVLLLTWMLIWPCQAKQSEDISRLPGYIDLEQFLQRDKELSTEVEIRNPLLSLVAMATEGEDADLSKMLRLLKLIKVYSFDVTPEDMISLAHRIQAADDKMIKAKWDRFVKIRKGNEVTNVYMKMNDSQIVGLAILSVDQNQASFVNIIGQIDMRSMSKLGEKFNIPKMDSMNVEKKK
jgi:hypothetical protein